MNGDEQIKHLFDGLEFTNEPPMSTIVADDVRRGQRQLRRHRIMTWTSGVAGAAVVATGVALVLPSIGSEPAADGLGVAGGGNDAPAVGEFTETAPPIDGEPGPAEADNPYPATRQLLLDTAVEHLDPERIHLPDQLNGFHGGGNQQAANVGTKLDWNNPGETGLGMVQVAVTSPGYATSDEFAVEGFGLDFGCAKPGSANCPAREVAGTGETVYVAVPGDPDSLPVSLGVVYQRPDGSLVGIGVDPQFGNNSEESVSSVDISLEQAIAFVTDPDLHVDPDDTFLPPDTMPPGYTSSPDSEGFGGEIEAPSDE